MLNVVQWVVAVLCVIIGGAGVAVCSQAMSDQDKPWDLWFLIVIGYFSGSMILLAGGGWIASLVAGS